MDTSKNLQGIRALGVMKANSINYVLNNSIYLMLEMTKLRIQRMDLWLPGVKERWGWEGSGGGHKWQHKGPLLGWECSVP